MVFKWYIYFVVFLEKEITITCYCATLLNVGLCILCHVLYVFQ